MFSPRHPLPCMLLLLLAGCSGSSGPDLGVDASGGDADVDASSDVGTAGDAALDDAEVSQDLGAECNTLEFNPLATAVPFSIPPGLQPVLNGGEFPDGTYYSASAWSSGATGTVRMVWRIQGDTLETLEETTGLSGADAIPPGTRSTYTLSTSGSTLVLTSRCGRPSFMAEYRYANNGLSVALFDGRVNLSLP